MTTSDTTGTGDRLLAAAVRGDQDAFAELVRASWPALWRAVLAVSGSRESAEDAVQEALDEGFRRLDRFDDLAQLRAWLQRTAVNRAIDLQRSDRARSDREQRAAAAERQDGADPYTWTARDPALLAACRALPAPGDGFEQRLTTSARGARTAALRRQRAASRRWWSSSRGRVLMVAAALVIGGGVAVSTVAFSDGTRPIRGPGGIAVYSREVRDSLYDNTLLREAPWIDQSHGSPPLSSVTARPSLVFPAGTTYDEAIEALYLAVQGRGELPAGAALGPPLPKDIVVAHHADRSALSLTAPYGYDIGTGNILLPALEYAPGRSGRTFFDDLAKAMRDGTGLPKGVKVAGNFLDPCQVITDGKRGPVCST